MRPSDWSLRWKLTALVLALILGLALAVDLRMSRTMAARGARSVERRSLAVVTVLAQAVTPALDFEDRTSAERSLAYLDHNPEALWAVVQREDGTTFAAWHDPGALERAPVSAPVVDLTETTATARAPVHTRSGTRGTLTVAFSLRELEAERREDQLGLLVLCGALVCLGVVGAYGIGSVLILPIRRVSLAARRVADGELQIDRMTLAVVPGSIHSGDETRQLTAAVVDMAHRLADQVARVENARALAEAAEARATEASTAKSSFLANMSHELRTPLNAIIGYAEMLAEEGTPSQATDLGKIRSAATHLYGLISQILDIAKIEAGRMEVLVEPVEVSPLVDDVLNVVNPMALRNANELTCSVPADVGRMETDGTKLRQVLLNLLSNATKFTRAGRIHLAVRRDGSTVVFTVSDTGIGMTRDQLERVFDPFTQADASTTKRFGGTGLGLTLARQFCEMLGGRVEVDSAPGAGSTFTVTLPDPPLR